MTTSITKNQVSLYIATHNKTGLKYFGKTQVYLTEAELQSKYHGSGKKWNDHLKEFGDDVTMKLYGIYSTNKNDKNYVKPIALKLSEEWDIVESNEWANSKQENGVDGNPKGVCPAKGWNKGIPALEENIQKARLTSQKVDENGLNGYDKSNIKRLKTTDNGNKIYKNNLTYNEFYAVSAAQTRKDYQKDINKKVSETKKKKTPKHIIQARVEACKRKMNEIMPSGLTRREESSLKQKETKRLKKLAKAKVS
jgi:hypothetical protein